MATPQLNHTATGEGSCTYITPGVVQAPKVCSQVNAALP
jgi:hypothetical protein